MPSELNIGENFKVTATIRNVSHKVVKGIILTLSAPYAIRLLERQIEHGQHSEEPIVRPVKLMARIDSLLPGEVQTIEWMAEAIASLEAGTMCLKASSEDGGASLSVLPIRVLKPVLNPFPMNPLISI
jgi:hypothetical protein